MKGTLTVGLVLSKLNHTLLKCIVNVDTDFADHDHIQLIANVTLLKNDLTFVIDSLVELVCYIHQSIAAIVCEEGNVLLQVHTQVEVLD